MKFIQFTCLESRKTNTKIYKYVTRQSCSIARTSFRELHIFILGIE